jgi:hypothetical protein
MREEVGMNGVLNADTSKLLDTAVSQHYDLYFYAIHADHKQNVKA